MKICIEPFVKYLLILTFIVLILVSLNGLMGEDEGRFSYMGRIWVENDLPPYSESVENKTPGIFILNAISFALFGTNIFFMRLLGICSLVLSAYLLYKIAILLHSKEAGIFSLVIFGLSMSWKMMDGAFTSYTESFMILFTVIAFYILTKTKTKGDSYIILLLLSGISLGFAIAFKQIAITSGVALVFYLILIKKEFKALHKKNISVSISLLFIGLLLGTIISILPILFSGVSISEYTKGSWLILADSGSTPDLSARILSARTLWLNSRIVFFYPFLILIVLVPQLLRKKSFIALLIWLAYDFIGVNASGYYFGHQIKQLMPALSITIGIIISEIIQKLSIDDYLKTKYKIKLISLLILFLLPYNLLFENFQKIKSIDYIDQNKELGLFIKESTQNSDFVYMMTNANALLSYTDRVSPTKFFNPLFVNNNEEHQEVLANIYIKKPKIIVKRQEEKQFTFPTEYHNYLSENYSILKQKFGYIIFHRK